MPPRVAVRPPVSPIRVRPAAVVSAAVATLVFASGCGSCAQSASDAGDAGDLPDARDLGAIDLGVDWDPDLGPWHPDPPVRVQFDPAVACAAPPASPSARPALPGMADGGTPVLIWSFSPSDDASVRASLRSFGVGPEGAVVSQWGLTELPDRGVAANIGNGFPLRVHSDGTFNSLGLAGWGSTGQRGFSVTSGGGDWYFVWQPDGESTDGVHGASITTPIVLLADNLGFSDGSLGAVDDTGYAVHGALDGLGGSCVVSGQFRWMVRLDASRRPPSSGPAYYKETSILLSGGDALFGPGYHPDIYRFDHDGTMMSRLRDPVPAEQYPRRDLIGYLAVVI